MEWSQEKVVQLIEAYRIREILWDPNNKQYFNKTLKNDAWNEISQEINVDVELAKKKMDNLLSQFRREKAKMKKTSGQGADEAYKPKWYAYEVMTFLLERNKPRHRINTEELEVGNSTVEGDQNNKSPNEQDQNEREENKQDQNEGSQNLDSEASGEKRSNDSLSENESLQNSNDNKNKSGKAVFKPPPAKKKKAKDPDTQMINSALDMLSTAATAAKEVSARNVTASSNVDDCQTYANYLASKFRLYSQRTKNALQHEISNLMFQADNGYFDYPSSMSSYGYSTQQPRASTQQRISVQSSPSTVRSEAPYTPSQNIYHMDISDSDTQDSFSDLMNL